MKSAKSYEDTRKYQQHVKDSEADHTQARLKLSNLAELPGAAGLLHLRLLHAVLALQGDTGALAQQIQQWLWQGTLPDRVALRQHIASLLRSVTTLCDAARLDLGTLMSEACPTPPEPEIMAPRATQSQQTVRPDCSPEKEVQVAAPVAVIQTPVRESLALPAWDQSDGAGPCPKCHIPFEECPCGPDIEVDEPTSPDDVFARIMAEFRAIDARAEGYEPEQVEEVPEPEPLPEPIIEPEPVEEIEAKEYVNSELENDPFGDNGKVRSPGWRMCTLKDPRSRRLRVFTALLGLPEGEGLTVDEVQLATNLGEVGSICRHEALYGRFDVLIPEAGTRTRRFRLSSSGERAMTEGTVDSDPAPVADWPKESKSSLFDTFNISTESLVQESERDEGFSLDSYEDEIGEE